MSTLTTEQARIARLEDEVRRIAVWAWGKDRAPAFLPIAAREVSAPEGSTLGDRLRTARKAARLSAKDLGARVGLTDVSVRAHETGQNGVSLDLAKAYADACGCAPQWLAWGVAP
ncbi:helix-turn-helix domain-containing protein [Brevundimonas vesicularis]|uniref:XRE family transcriptional regulator n=1 Tax=Brevundimonas vesicularis TaxID=41276 RepID=A0A1Z3U782_BREVE|nr:helix-turn-helix transcriptional regulator [Brevundimonas vesicularis]ASE39115.1 XRE family transcriptional regulator [Brevundimonas vesicularis]